MSRGYTETHRCEAKPKWVSIRKTEPGAGYCSTRFGGGWELAKAVTDVEWDATYLEVFNARPEDSLRFCPWCGAKLSKVVEGCQTGA